MYIIGNVQAKVYITVAVVMVLPRKFVFREANVCMDRRSFPKRGGIVRRVSPISTQPSFSKKKGVEP